MALCPAWPSSVTVFSCSVAVGQACTQAPQLTQSLSMKLPPCPAVTRDSNPRPEMVSRSEEHTSELQSPCNLVCRLLLEKKNKHRFHHRRIYPRGLAAYSLSYEASRPACAPRDPSHTMRRHSQRFSIHPRVHVVAFLLSI